MNESFEFSHITEPVRIEKSHVPNPTKTDQYLLQAVKAHNQNMSREQAHIVDQYFDLNKIPDIEGIHQLQGNLEQAIHKAANHNILYPYAYLKQGQDGFKAHIVLLHPFGAEDNYEITTYRKACFVYSIPALRAIAQNSAQRAPYQSLNSLMETLLPPGGHFKPERLSLESEIMQVIHQGFHHASFALHSPLKLKGFYQDLLAFLQQEESIQQILPDYHIAELGVELDEQGNYKQLPNLYSHLYAQGLALEQYLLPSLEKLAQEQFQEEPTPELKQKLQAHYYHQKQSDLTSPKGIARNHTFIDLASFAIDNLFLPAEIDHDKISYSVRLQQAMLDLLPTYDNRKNQALSEHIYNYLAQKIHADSTQIDSEHFGFQGITITEIDLAQEISRYPVSQEQIPTMQGEILERLKKRFAYHQETRQGKSWHYFAEAGYLSGILSNLAAQAKSHSHADRLFIIGRKMEDKLRNNNDKRLNAKLTYEQIKFFEKDIARTLEKSSGDSSWNWPLMVTGLALFFLYGILVFNFPQAWPVILFLIPLGLGYVLVDYMQNQVKKGGNILEQMRHSLQGSPGNKSSTSTAKNSPQQKKRLAQHQKALQSEKPRPSRRQPPPKRAETTTSEEPSLLTMNKEEALRQIQQQTDKLWQKLLEDERHMALYPPDLAHLAESLDIEEDKFKKFMRVNQNDIQKILVPIYDKNTEKRFYISRDLLNDKKEKIKEYYKAIYNYELNQNDFIDQARMDFAHYMLTFLAQKN